MDFRSGHEIYNEISKQLEGLDIAILGKWTFIHVIWMYLSQLCIRAVNNVGMVYAAPENFDSIESQVLINN